MSLSLPLAFLVGLGLLAACSASEPKLDPNPVSTRRQALSSDSHGCAVQISKLNYENPGTDTREYLELRVTPPLVVDAGTLTFASCGLEYLELFNGGSGCQPYRSILLKEMPIPESGLVGVCAQDSELAATCVITTAGSSALRNGWLQNGPDDGFRIIGSAGVVQEYVYARSATGCAPSASQVLPTETGALPGSGEDDVAVLCDGQYSLVPTSGVSLGTEHACGAAEPSVSVSATTTLSGVSGFASGGSSGIGLAANEALPSSGIASASVDGATGVVPGAGAGGTPPVAPEAPLGSARVVGEISQIVPTYAAGATVDAGTEPALRTGEHGGEFIGPPGTLSCAVGTAPGRAPGSSWAPLLASLFALACRRRTSGDLRLNGFDL